MKTEIVGYKNGYSNRFTPSCKDGKWGVKDTETGKFFFPKFASSGNYLFIQAEYFNKDHSRATRMNWI